MRESEGKIDGNEGKMWETKEEYGRMVGKRRKTEGQNEGD